MRIEVKDISKSYNRQEIFAGVSGSFDAPGAFAIQGSNGSGKSTLLRCLSGLETSTEGEVLWQVGLNSIPPEKIYQQVAICAPWISLYEELNCVELFALTSKFKTLQIDKEQDFLELLELPLAKIKSKAISKFSSGMKQRVKLALCLLQEVPFYFVDEPCSNLDKKAISWYLSMIERFTQGKLLFVATNNFEEEAPFSTPAFDLNT